MIAVAEALHTMQHFAQTLIALLVLALALAVCGAAIRRWE